MGDSAYSCNKFVQPLYKIDNVVTITRARRNKAIYKKYVDKKEGSGRKRHYGEKSKLNDPDSLPTPNFAEEFEEVLKNGSIQTVKLSVYEGYICRGSKDYKMSHVEVNFVKVEILKDCLSYSLPTIPHVIAGWILDLSDRIFIERYYALADVGMYSIACKIGNLLLVISGAFRKAYMPYFYRLALDDNQSEVKKTLYFLNNN